MLSTFITLQILTIYNHLDFKVNLTSTFHDFNSSFYSPPVLFHFHFFHFYLVLFILLCCFHLVLFCPIPDSVFCFYFIMFFCKQISTGQKTSKLPVNLTPAYRPSADQGHWWLQIHLTITQNLPQSVPSAHPVPWASCWSHSSIQACCRPGSLVATDSPHERSLKSTTVSCINSTLLLQFHSTI